MTDILSIMSKEERAAFSLCALYEDAGFKKYRMSKFEEYALYVQNKDFLVSENVITFTDTDGKLLALKPDVTLSIIKNTRPTDGVMKVYYKENVYRVSKGTRSYSLALVRRMKSEKAKANNFLYMLAHFNTCRPDNDVPRCFFGDF